MFTGCFEGEKKEVKKRKPVQKMAKKVVDKVKKDKPLSEVVEDDGIVVDGARDEKLLDAFGLAVSQVMINDGVSVPDCASLSKTGFLTKEECEEITDKYTGFYEVTESDNLEKVDNIFNKGVEGKGVELGEGIEFFDSSGNPLLNNDVEFNEFVENNDDVGLLKKLKSKIPKENIEMLKNVEQKIAFLEDVEKVGAVKVEALKESTESTKQEVVNVTTLNDISQSSGNSTSSDAGVYKSAKASLVSAQNKLADADAALNLYPNNQRLINDYNEAFEEVSHWQSIVDSYQ